MQNEKVAVIGIGEETLTSARLLLAMRKKEVDVVVVDAVTHKIAIDEKSPLAINAYHLLRGIKKRGVRDMDDIFLMLLNDPNYLKDLGFTNVNCKKRNCYGRGWVNFNIAAGHHELCSCVGKSNKKYIKNEKNKVKYSLKNGERVTDAGIVLLK